VLATEGQLHDMIELPVAALGWLAADPTDAFVTLPHDLPVYVFHESCELLRLSIRCMTKALFAIRLRVVFPPPTRVSTNTLRVPRAPRPPGRILLVAPLTALLCLA
jgi:hypothetical protein